jgi:phenylacetate-CoA ligase
MMQLALRLYQHLPAPAQSLVATLRGVSERWSRYGPGSQRVTEEAREREHWTPAQWDAWRAERLAFVLHRAATRVPYYRDYWMARRSRGDRAPWDLLENWPILEKETVRRQPRAFVADDRSLLMMSHLRTSGTTGTPLDIWRTRKTIRALYGLGLARTRGWHGITLDHRWAMLGGRMVTAAPRRRPPFWVWNASLRQLYMSSYHLAPDLIPYYLDALVQYRVQYIVSYTSSLHALAQEALRLGRRDLKVIVALTNSEPLYDHQREAIGAAFQCPVRETYGMGENVAAATECEAGRLHQWPEAGLIEVFDGEQPVPRGAFGEFICTGLLNPDMPFIRYRLADCGRLPANEEPCPCGRTLPSIASLDGRTNDLLLTRDGRRVAWMNPVLYGIPVRQAQFVQESLDRILVRYVQGPEFTVESQQTIVERVRSRMGDVQVVLQEVTEIPRSANGKIRSMICAVPAAEREAVLAASQAVPRAP